MTADDRISQPIKNNNSLNLSLGQAIGMLWFRRMKLLATTISFAVVGSVVGLLSQSEYSAEARIMPEMNQGAGDMFKRLASAAGFAGMDLGETEGVDAVRPDLYPNVLQSTPFILYLLQQSVPTVEGKQKTVTTLLTPTLGWFSTQKKSLALSSNKPSAVLHLTQEQQDLAEDIQKRVAGRMDTRSGVITINARMPDPVAVAAVAQLTMDYLTQYVTNYRTEKARRDLQFYTNRLNEAKRRYQVAQYALFKYNDQHKYMVVQAATMDQQRINAELDIAQTVYAELAKQYEQAKIKVQERTPVFKVLDPPKVPLVRVSPKRTVMVVIYALVGLMVGSLYILLTESDTLERLRQRFITVPG